MSMKNKRLTMDFLVAQGCDTSFAKYLSRRYTLEELKAKSISDLKNMGLRNAVAEDIQKGRPPIPTNILDSVLQKNLRICCVCYKDALSVIVHHIKPYSKEKKHEESNLCVLCLQCHGRAHTKYELEQNLDQAALLMHKQTWEAAVAHRKVWALYPSGKGQPEDRWEWVNLKRLESVIKKMGISLPTTSDRETLTQSGHIEENGYCIRPVDPKEKQYATDVGIDQITLAGYIAYLVEWVADQVPVLDLTIYCGQPELLARLIEKEMFVCARVEFGVNALASGQFEGIGRNGRLTVKFGFDQWNFTSSTSRTIGWEGKVTSLVAFGIVRAFDVDKHTKDITIDLSPIGISTRYRPNDYFAAGYFVN